MHQPTKLLFTAIIDCSASHQAGSGNHFPLHCYKRQFDPVAEGNRGFLCNRFTDGWISCTTTWRELFLLSNSCTRAARDNTDIYKNGCALSLILPKNLQSPKAPAAFSGMPEQQLKGFPIYKTFLCLRHLVKILYFSFYRSTDTLLWKFFTWSGSCSYIFQVRVSLTRSHSNSNVLF